MIKNLPINTKLVTISQAADILGISVETVRRWDKKGLIQCSRGKCNVRYFSVEELENMVFSKPLSVSEAASKLGISVETLKRLEEKGIISSEPESHGGRKYTKASLTDFLNEEYFLRKKQIEENSQDEKEVIKSAPDRGGVNEFLVQEEKKINTLIRFTNAVYVTAILVGAVFAFVVITITVFFLFFPDATASFLGYSQSDSYAMTAQPADKSHLAVSGNTANRAVLGIQTKAGKPTLFANVLKPFSRVSLNIVKVINNDTYKQVVPQEKIENMNNAFVMDRDNTIVANQPIKITDASDLQIEDKKVVENLNSQYIQGRVPGNSEGNLVVFSDNNTIPGLTITVDQIKGDYAIGSIPDGSLALEKLSPKALAALGVQDSSVTSAKLADGSVTLEKLASGVSVLGNDGVTSEKVKDGEIKTADLADGAISDSKLGQITSGNKIAGSAIQLAADGGLVNSSGLSLLTSCNTGEILSWSGTAWVCAAAGGGGGSYDAGTDLDLTGSTFSLETALDSVDTINLAGTGTLNGLDAIDGTTESTIESAIDTLGNLTSASTLATVGTLTSGGTGTGFMLNFTNSTLTGNITGSNIDESTLAGLTTSNFTSANISQWTNNSGYITTSTTDTLTNKTIAAASNTISGLTAANLTAGDFSSVINNGTYSIGISGTAATATNATDAVHATHADTAGVATTSADLTCINCIGGTEIDESTLSGLGTSNFGSANISQWTNNSGYITGNQTITLGGDISGSGTTAITTTIGAGKVGASQLGSAISLGSGQTLSYGSGTLTANALAAGTYGINIAGNAATATNATDAVHANYADVAGTATTSADLTCTNCVGGTEIDESTLSGLAVSNFSSANISQWTNNSGYITDGNTGWDNSYGLITASSSDTLTNKTIAAGNNTISGITSTNLTAGDFSSAITSGTYSIDISGNASSATNATTVTNGVYTTGSYANPAWITSLAGSKVSGNISGNAATATNATDAVHATYADSSGVATTSADLTCTNCIGGTEIDESTLSGITKSQVGLANVENTALSTWAGTSSLTTVGTLTSGGTGTGFTLNFTNSTLTGNITGANISGVDVSDDTNLSASDGVTLTGDALTNNDKGSSQNIFKTIAVSGQSNVVSDTNVDTLTLIAGTNITLTTDASNDTVTINATGGGGSYDAGTDLDLTGSTFSLETTLDSVDTINLAGTGTLNGIDVLDATSESTIESAVDTLSNLTSASLLATVGTLTSGATGAGFTLNFGTSTLSGNITGSNIDESSLSGLAVSNFASANISQWTNNAGYITASSSDTLTNKTIAAGSNTISGLTASNLTAGDFSSAITSGTYSINVSGTAATASDLTCTNCIGGTEIDESTLGAITATSLTVGSGATSAPLSVRGGIGSNSAFIVDQLNSGDLIAASASGTTKFRVDASGNTIASGTINGATLSGGSLSGGSLTGTAVNGVATADIALTSGSYVDPSWITSLAKSKVGLGSVENTALSTWAGTSNITTLGTLTSGTTGTGFTLNFSNSTLSGNITGTNISGIDVSDDTNFSASDGVTLTGDALTNSDKGSSQNIFKTVAVSGQSNVVSDANSDTLTLVAGTNVTLTTDASTDAVTINATGGGSYDAGTDLDLTTTTFSLETTLDSVDTINLAGTGAINGLDAIDATTESTIENAIDTLSNLTSASSLVTVGTLTGGGTGAGFTLNFGTSTLTGNITGANIDESSFDAITGTSLNAGSGTITTTGTIGTNGSTAFTGLTAVLGSGATSAPLSVRGGIGSNAGFIVDQLNSGDLIAASASGTTKFRVDSSGNVIASGTFNGATISGGSVSGGSLTAAAVNGVTTADIALTSGSYADPSWITSLAKSKVGLGSVENTALSTWAGTSSITTTGTLTGGTTGTGFTLNFTNSTLSGNITATNIDESTFGAITGTSLSAGSGTITTSGTIGTASTTTFTGAGGTFSSAVAANGGITFDAATDTLGAHTLAGDLDANTNLVTNIGNAGTDFLANGGLTLANALTVTTGGLTITAGALVVNSDSITADGATLTINAAGNVDIQDALNADSITSDAGVSIAAGSSYTGAGAVTLSSGAAAGLTIDSASGTITISDALGIGTNNIVTGATTIASTELDRLDGKDAALVDQNDFTSADGAGATSNGSGLEAGAGGIGLLQGCSNDQVLKWNEASSTWNCATDSTSGTSKFVVKGSNENVPSGTTLQSDNELTFAVGSGETWVFDFVLRVTNVNSATPDWKSAILGASGWTCSITLSGVEPLGAAFPQATGTDCDNAPTALANGTILADVNVPFQVNMRGSVVTNSAGSVTLQWAPNTSGSLTVMAGSYVIAQKVGGADLAEVYYGKEGIDAGTVVSLDSSLTNGVKKSEGSYDRTVLGIVSTKPGLLLGDDQGMETGVPVQVALSGRVPVKVSDENGSIKPGDLLTSSSTPGVAMRATKAGQIVGQAMTAFEGGGEGTVIAFIKTDYANGSKISDILPEGKADSGKAVLEEFITQKQNAQAFDFSEIVTDRVAAGLEVIAPRIIADELSINSIKPATGKDIALHLTSDGKFIIKDEDGKEAIIFDDKGNAFFAGMVTADKIKANQIEGLEILVSNIKGQVLSEATPSAVIASDSEAIPGNESPSYPRNDVLTLTSLNVDGLATVSGALRVKNNALVEGILNVVDALTTSNLIVSKVADFFGNVIFHGDVAFKGRPTFNNDTAGMAIIKKDATEVEVKFEKEYTQRPIITANITLDGLEDQAKEQAMDDAMLNGDIKFVITKRTTKGFSIKLNKKATFDTPFSWTVLSVEDAKTSESAIESFTTPFVTEALSPTPQQ